MLRQRNVRKFGSNDKLLFTGLVTVLTVLVQTTHAQAYLLTISQNQIQNQRSVYTEALEIGGTEDSQTSPNNQTQDGNSTIIYFKNSARDNPSELSQTAMDIITIVWYVATFLALAAFFLLMACSDRRCADTPGTGANNETPMPPPTPSPSYSEFAPPSYETVMKMQHAARTTIFVIPFSTDNAKENSSGNTNSLPSTPTTPIVNFYTINELQKLGS